MVNKLKNRAEENVEKENEQEENEQEEKENESQQLNSCVIKSLNDEMKWMNE